jgi:hypothetical protein
MWKFNLLLLFILGGFSFGQTSYNLDVPFPNEPLQMSVPQIVGPNTSPVPTTCTISLQTLPDVGLMAALDNLSVEITDLRQEIEAQTEMIQKLKKRKKNIGIFWIIEMKDLRNRYKQWSKS